MTWRQIYDDKFWAAEIAVFLRMLSGTQLCHPFTQRGRGPQPRTCSFVGAPGCLEPR